MSISLATILLSLFFSAFFSGMEIAYVSANKIHIEIEKKQGTFLSKILSKLTAKPSKFIATMLIGNNIALVIYGFFMGDFLMSCFKDLQVSNGGFITVLLLDFSLLTQTVISTLVILFTAEFLPKVFFRIYANTLIKILAFPAYLFYLLFTFIADFILWISDFVLKKIFKTEGDQVQLAFSKIELGHYISEQMESVQANDDIDTEIQIFQNALEFAEVKAREVMVPRTEIVALDINNTVANLSDLFTKTGLSKILIYKVTIDNIVGYAHAFELFKKPKSIRSMLLPVQFVPETMLVNDILDSLTKKRKSIAVVLDEYGGTSGIITVEDIVEELFGEIQDEHDTIVLKEEKINDLNYIFSARLEVDHINEIYKINLPEGENYETLGGLIVSHTEEIPKKNDLVDTTKFQFKILEVSNTKIDLVALKIKTDY